MARDAPVTVSYVACFTFDDLFTVVTNYIFVSLFASTVPIHLHNSFTSIVIKMITNAWNMVDADLNYCIAYFHNNRILKKKQ